MDYIIENQINVNDKTQFQTRVLKVKSFEDYINKIKNNEVFIIKDMFNNNSGCSICKNAKIEIIKEDLTSKIFIYKMTLFNNEERICYLNLTHSDIAIPLGGDKL